MSAGGNYIVSRSCTVIGFFISGLALSHVQLVFIDSTFQISVFVY